MKKQSYSSMSEIVNLISSPARVIILFAMLTVTGCTEEYDGVLKSPDGNVSVTFAVKDFDGAKACPVYSVSYLGKEVVADSKLGLDIEGAPLGEKLKITDGKISKHDSTWKPVYGERSTVRDCYREAVVELQETEAPNRSVSLAFRVYNEGAAFSYSIPVQPGLQSIKIKSEKTEFRFPADYKTWAVYSAQGKYAEVKISEVKKGCERPLTIQAGENVYIAVGEARLVDYARMKFEPLAGHANALVSSLDGEVEAALPLKTPWRFVMVGNSPGQLLEHNDLLLNLNEPCVIKDTSWIKPGKVIREVTLTTVGGKACVDFAVKHNLQYVEYDAGWYGPEYSDESDASTITLDEKRSKGPLDLHDVIKYAKDRGIGVILYVNRRALEKQLDDILPLYRSWGIKGLKYGFVNVGPQKWTSWMHEAIRKAADYGMMVDVHDEYRPTGYSRTYPNFMTQEGIGGDETSPVNEQTLMILFARYLAGAADNTICYYDGRVDKNATHAYQLAKAVCLYSPWQFLYWYDRPPSAPATTGGAGGSNPQMGDEPELEFYDHVPTVWDDTKVIHGVIGKYAVMARRSGRDWYIGCMNSGEGRTLDVPLSFLDKGCEYTAWIYSDDPEIKTRTKVRIEKKTVSSETVLKVSMTENGGQAVRIVAH